MSTNKNARTRKTNLRKSITSQIRTLEKLRTALEKAQPHASSIATLGFPDDSRQQLLDIGQKLQLIDTVLNATIENRAKALAGTFLGK